MKKLPAIVLTVILAGLTGLYAQNEQSPIVEKEIAYKNWNLRSVADGSEKELRSLIKGKKLAIIVYYAPWCPNWRHDLTFLPRLYDKYKAAGLEIIGVAEYDPLEGMKANADAYKIAFPLVYESDSRAQRTFTDHFRYRDSTGDKRKWGSPWYIFLEPSKLAAKGDVLTSKAFVINGEMVEAEGEKFIRERLGLPAETPKGGIARADPVEVCDPAKPAELKITDPKKTKP